MASVTYAIIRHGQTDWNRLGLFQGSSDTPLNDTGRQQARDLVPVLQASGIEWSAVVSSPLFRARETAGIVAEGLGLRLGAAYDELVERDYGRHEGQPDETEKKSDPSVEPLESVVLRGVAGLDRVARDHGDAHVVVVAHGSIIRYTLARLAGRPMPTIANGLLTTLERTPAGEWRVDVVNGTPVEVRSQP
ncbi:histidine phosphatase family protein [Terracoccus luteus]|uniref:histidine phosphatase family protein n=1 Tax=Terracoccus luteus TaxID=53356 RepID=UPI000EB09C37|nr:histidine phosphatase family protein [Terracoccus luteus]